MRKIILLCELFCLIGCYQFHEDILSPEQTLANFNQRTIQKHLEESSDNQQEWDLNELTLAAFQHNDSLKEMCAYLREAEGAATIASEIPNPAVGLAPGFNSSTSSSAGISPWILDLVIDMPIETMGKRAVRTAQANFRIEAARLKIASKAWSIRNQLRESLLKIYETEAREKIIAQRRELIESEQKIFKARMAAGDISAVELQDISLKLEANRNLLLEKQRQKREALSCLAQTIGIPACALKGIRFDFSDFDNQPAAIPVPESRRTSLLNRADLLAELAEYNSAQMSLKEEVLKQYPDLQISPGYTFDQSENKWSLGISFTLPAFNRNRGAIKSAEARRSAARAVFMQHQAEIAAEIELDVERYNAYESQLRNSLTLKQQNENLVITTKEMVRNGELSELEYKLAELRCNYAQENLLQAKINVLNALGSLEDAMQHPADNAFDPFTEINRIHGGEE